MDFYMDGFDWCEGETLSTVLPMMGYSVGVSVSTATGRLGVGKAITLYNAPMLRGWVVSGNLVSVGTAFMMGGRGGLLSLAAGGITVDVWADKSDGLIRSSNGGEGYVLPIASRWYYLEARVDRAAKTLQLFINGRLDSTSTLPDAFCADTALTVGLNPVHGEQENSKQYDDFYIVNGERLGPIQITTRLPTATVQAEWGVYGAATHPAAVGKLPTDKLNRYIQSGTDGARDIFTSDKPLPNSNALVKLGVLTLMRRSTSEPVAVDMSIGSNVAKVTDLTKTWGYRYAFFDPTGYDSASIKDAPFGVTIDRG